MSRSRNSRKGKRCGRYRCGSSSCAWCAGNKLHRHAKRGARVNPTKQALGQRP